MRLSWVILLCLMACSSEDKLSNVPDRPINPGCFCMQTWEVLNPCGTFLNVCTSSCSVRDRERLEVKIVHCIKGKLGLRGKGD